MIHQTFDFSTLKDIFDDTCIDYKVVEIIDIDYNEDGSFFIHEMIFQSILEPTQCWSWQFNMHDQDTTLDSEINQETHCVRVRQTTKTVTVWELDEEKETL